MCLCLDMGQYTVFQLLGFVVVISQKCIPIATLFCCLWWIGSPIRFVCHFCFSTVYMGLSKMFVWWGPLLFVTCFTFYAFTGCSILCFYVLRIVSLWCGSNGTTVLEWLALRHVVLALSSVFLSLDLLVYVVSGENFLPFL